MGMAVGIEGRPAAPRGWGGAGAERRAVWGKLWCLPLLPGCCGVCALVGYIVVTRGKFKKAKIKS